MPPSALAKFQEFAAASTPQEAWKYLLANPVLLAHSMRPVFQAWVDGCPEEAKPTGNRALVSLFGIAERLVQNPSDYPVGGGPIEAIIERLHIGEITDSHARELASRADVSGNLSPIYVAALSMRNQVQANDGKWNQALLAQNVLLSALDARRPTGAPEQDVMDMIAAVDYVVIVARCVWDFADGRLFYHAVRRASAVTKVETRPWHEPGAVEFSLGSLYQDPYTYERTPTSFDLTIETWRRRPLDRFGSMLGDLEARDLLVPDPLSAFTSSSEYFMKSANKRSGIDRAFSLKGYIGAEVWKQIAGGRSASNLTRIADEAKGLLQDDRYLGVRAEIDSLIDIWRGESEKSVGNEGLGWEEAANRVLNTSTEKLVEKRGVTQAIDFIQNVAFAVAPTSKKTAFALWQKALPLVMKRDENTRKGFYAVGLGYIRALVAHPDVEKFIASKPPLESAAECERQAAAEGWPPRQLAASLLSIAVNSHAGDREAEGVKVLERIPAVDSGFANDFQPLLLWHSGVLHQAVASNMFHADRYADSIVSYSAAARQFLATNMPENAEEMMALAVDIVNRFAEHLAGFVERFRTVIPELERQAGTTVTRRVQDLCRNWMPLLAKDGQLNLPVSMLLLDAVKGSAFASECRAGGDLAWIDSDQSHTMLNRIEKMQSAAGSVTEAADAGTLNEEILLTMYADDDEMLSGSTSNVALHNLQVRYDTELRRQLSGRASREEAWTPTPTNVSSVLQPETVLMAYYSGNIPSGNSGLYVSIFTNDSATSTIIDLGVPGTQVLMNGLLDTLAVNVARVRENVNLKPQDGVLSAEARQAIEACRCFTAGATGQILSQLRKRGKWHLCIQPHGPLHFFPFHLLPSESGVLADEWTITYLPNLAMLDPALRKAPVRDVSIASFGIDFENGLPHGLPKLPGAEDEAESVATAYHLHSMPGALATETALISSLGSARRVHIATHGLQRVSAPSFQRVYLWPDANSDGIVNAYELLRCDLRGLDLLTLSACETVLGRVDLGDNFWGLSANALIGGTATVVGTLWAVENSAAKMFFRELHQKLAEGSGKREAFRMAQQYVQSRRPQFRDWGAFCYTGRW